MSPWVLVAQVKKIHALVPKFFLVVSVALQWFWDCVSLRWVIGAFFLVRYIIISVLQWFWDYISFYCVIIAFLLKETLQSRNCVCIHRCSSGRGRACCLRGPRCCCCLTQYQDASANSHWLCGYLKSHMTEFRGPMTSPHSWLQLKLRSRVTLTRSYVTLNTHVANEILQKHPDTE